MFASHPDLLEWLDQPAAPAVVEIWQPGVVDKEHWPPNYMGVYAWRMKQLALIRANPAMLRGAKVYYRMHKDEFIMHWVDTFNPKKKSGKRWVPFIFFPKQYEYYQFLESCVADDENGLVEKSRDMGITWLSAAWSIATWLFDDDVSIGFGSRKKEYVDRIGDPDSIFEKLRLILRRIPREFLPDGWSPREHATEMKLINPENGSTITGEIGDSIGRGGRKTVYFKDESAHYEHPDMIESALGDNTNCQIDISSVNGFGNVFHRKREAGYDWSPRAPMPPGRTRVFVADWSDHPEKTQAWYDMRRMRMENEGLLHLFSQEVDRNYSASVSNTIIAMEWIIAATDAHLKLGIPDEGGNVAGLDLADGGGDTNALARRKSITLRQMDEWGAPDVGRTTRHAIDECLPYKSDGIRIMYDSVGIGSTVKSEWNRLSAVEFDEKGNEIRVMDLRGLQMVPWSAGASVLEPFARIIADDENSPFNRDFFYNMKAQAWWSLRLRFFRTWQAVTLGIVHDFANLISLDSRLPLLHKLQKELAQPTKDYNGQMKMIVEKKPDGTKSPNLADAVVMCYFPIPDDNFPLSGRHGS